MPPGPIVRDFRRRRIHPHDLVRIMGLRRAIRDDRGLRTYPLEAVPDARGHRDQGVVVFTRKEFLECPLRRGTITAIVQDELNHSTHHCVVQSHPLVQMPTLHHAGIDHREVNLSESLKPRVVAPQTVHYLPSRVRNLSAYVDLDSL